MLGSRADVSGWSECTNQEHFELTDIARRILGNANILQWCRSLIRNPGTRSISVITSAVNILKHVSGDVSDKHDILSEHKVRKMIRRYVFRGEEDQEGIQKL